MLDELLKQAPGIAALIFVVLKFLSHMRAVDKERADRHAETVERVSENFETAAKECHKVQREVAKQIAAHTVAITVLVTKVNGTGSGAGKVEA